jgi:glycosyltransferase involved in cell wall biosynthesis
MKLSICIPTYEMGGKGVEYLGELFQSLANQSFRDFEVIVSDHSVSVDIENLCNQWKSILNIKHYYNDVGRGSLSINTNNAIKKATGEIVKILFQDDLLYDNTSLETLLVHFLGNHNHWLVSACCHLKNNQLVNPHYPRYHDNIQYGENTISSPSVLMFKNEDLVLFDENLVWLMDVDYYKRLYDTFGLPSICNYITTIIREHDTQATNTIATTERKNQEYQYITDKYREILELKNVTIVAVAGVRAQETLKAIKYSCRNIKFARALLITPEDIVDDEIEIVKCEPLNYEEYNHYIVYKLHEHINTEYALIIQDDGFVVNPDKWDNSFLDFDYIGAPWPLPQDDYSFKDASGIVQRVGNGGFTLRTKKLLSLASELNLEWKSYHNLYNEDGFFCCHNRHIYEQHGCKFADIYTAAKFSHETPTQETQHIIPFGFHGKNHYYYKYTFNK